MHKFLIQPAVAVALLLIVNASGLGATATQPVATQPAVTDPIHERLARAKSDYDTQVDAAHRKFAAYLATRADSAQKRGDLAGLETFQTMKTAFETQGQLAENSTDLALRDNINNYLSATRLAAKTLGNAYTAAIRDYTKANLIDQADVLQAEADSFQKQTPGTAIASTPSVPSASITPSSVPFSAPVGNGLWFTFSATSGLPKYFEPNSEVQLANDGLTFPGTGFLRTAKTDFINTDFAFDAIIVVRGKEILKVGIGQGSSGKPAFYGMELNNGVANAVAVGLLGKVADGTHLVHIEKKGFAFTSAIVLNYNGKYNPDYIRTSDIRHLKYLTADNTRLFIAANGPGIVIKQVRLTIP